MSALPPKADMCGAARDVCFGPKADMEPFCRRALICSSIAYHVVSHHRAADALKRKIADCLNRYVLLNCHQNTRANQYLPGLSFVAKPRSDVGYRSDGGIIEASLKADGAKRGKSVRNPEVMVVFNDPIPNIMRRLVGS
jgi:hypothetical protein